MIKGLKINIQGLITEINYINTFDMVEDNSMYSPENYVCVEIIELGNNIEMEIYACQNTDYPYNNFNLMSINSTGDIFVVLARGEDYIDITENIFTNHYNVEEDIDYEEEDSEEDDYDMTDPFIVNDNDELDLLIDNLENMGMELDTDSDIEMNY